MNIRDNIIMLALSEIAMQCVEENKLSFKEFKGLFEGCDINKMQSQFQVNDNIVLEELKFMLKEYADIIKEEQMIFKE